jgi:hypothetical protein
MSERDGTRTPSSPGTMPIVVGQGATAASAPAPEADPTAVLPSAAPEPAAQEPTAQPTTQPTAQPTAPVAVRPKPRLPRRGPLTVMGPWAPVAGGLLGLLLGVVVVLFLAGIAESFEDRLALVFAVLGLGMLGTSGVLLADEVRMIRQQAREAAVRPQWVETTASLVNGLTPARLLLTASALVLFLAAYVSRG